MIGFSNYYQGFPTSQAANSTNGYPYTAPYVGLTIKTTVTWAAYRFFIMDPVTFQSAIKLTWDAGELSFVNWTGTVRIAYCVWYYTT
jgi:DUF2961 family protein